MENKAVTDKAIQVIKYFRNTHLPGAWLRASGNNKLILPCETRWHGKTDALECYLSAWPKLLSIVEEHREEMKKDIYTIIPNIAHKRQVEDLLKIYKPVAMAIDRMQAAKVNLADAVKIWLVLDPRYVEIKLTADEESSALDFASELHPELFSYIMKFRTKTEPFLSSHFDTATDVHPSDWWKLARVPEEISKIVERFSLARRLLDLWKDFSAHSVGFTRRNETDSGLRKPEKWSFA